jgi:hypothetical protein
VSRVSGYIAASVAFIVFISWIITPVYLFISYPTIEGDITRLFAFIGYYGSGVFAWHKVAPRLKKFCNEKFSL